MNRPEMHSVPLVALDYIAELEAKLELYRYALQTIADEEETLGWLYPARIAKTALGVSDE